MNLYECAYRGPMPNLQGLTPDKTYFADMDSRVLIDKKWHVNIYPQSKTNKRIAGGKSICHMAYNENFVPGFIFDGNDYAKLAKIGKN